MSHFRIRPVWLSLTSIWDKVGFLMGLYFTGFAIWWSISRWGWLAALLVPPTGVVAMEILMRYIDWRVRRGDWHKT